jgi:asparagine synthase (glutamine-hydrolysing)
MCGIFGAINFDGNFNKQDFDRFCQLTDLVSYRGPDSYGYKSINTFTKELSEFKFNVFLGHRRLSIIDLSSDGDQPFFSDNCWIIFNGEIFNYIELKNDLKAEGITFRTNTDTEVILKIYKKYGETGFDKFNGMWAFAIYDSEKNLIILSRDRFSIKPFFKYQTEKKLFFASEIKQLIPLLDKKMIEFETMQTFLQQGLLEIDNKTFFKGIERIEAKTNLLINLNDKSIKQNKYWDYSKNINHLSYTEAEEKFLYLLTESVRIRLRSDVSLGSLLSGGLDSSAITAIASQFTTDKLNTYSVVSSDKESNEEYFIDIFTKHYSINNKKLSVETKSINHLFDKVLFHQDEPFNYLIVLVHFQLIETLKNNSDIVVVLNGQGGDEVLLGYLRFYFFYLKKLIKQGKVYNFLNELISSLFNRTALWQFKINAAKRYLPEILLKDKVFLKKRNDLIEVWKFSDLREAQINDIDKYSVPYINRYEDRNSMAFSKEIRLPFLDHRLVDFLINLPPNFKLKKGWSKYILRSSLQNLPPKIRWRRDKKGFSLPEDYWLKTELKNVVFNNFNFNKSYLSQNDFIDDKLFLDYFYKYLNGESRIHFTDINRVLIAEKWAQLNFGNNNEIL